MSELKEYINGVFTDLRSKLEIEYKHQLKNHFANMTDNLSTRAFTDKYGELSKEKLMPRANEIIDRSRRPGTRCELSRPELEVLRRLRLPKAIEGRWWIHITCSEEDNITMKFKINIYDNFGQAHTRNLSYDPQYYSLTYDNYNMSNDKVVADPKYQYPLTDRFIDFVKKQSGTLNDLNTMGDMFHQIIYLYAI